MIMVRMSEEDLRALQTLWPEKEALQKEIALSLSCLHHPLREVWMQRVESSYGSEDLEVDTDAIFAETRHGVWVQTWSFLPRASFDHEQHDLLCATCGVELNNQCLDPDCSADDPHSNGDAYCEEHTVFHGN